MRSLIFFALAACASSSLPAGAECSQTSDCSSGLTCLEFGQFSGSACTTVGKMCSSTCTSNTDCGHLGPSFTCLASCGSAMVCGATGQP